MMPGLLPALPCLLLLSLPGPSAGSDDDGTVVLTTSGPIRGKHLLAGSGTVTAFLGVPYAEPPLGPLHFQKLLPHQPWNDILEATGFGHACPQPPLSAIPQAEIYTPKTSQSKDYLFLNLWVPHPQPNGTAPVLVWIHGGGFYLGAASLDLYDGRFFAATENVIIASMNYRLGALGFLALPPAAPGNAGLWDQRLALRWLRDNAAAFGGDPEHVMIDGQDAGAASVGFHLLSPGSQSLFAPAVLLSGAPNAPGAWVSLEESQERGQRLAQRMGCSSGDSTALVGCLQGKDVEEFLKYEFSVFSHKQLPKLPFVPTPDGDFLPDTPPPPPRLLRAQHGPAKSIGIGLSANDGSYPLYQIDHTFDPDNASSIGWDEVLQVVQLLVPRAPEGTVRAVAQRYSQEGEEEGTAWYCWAMDQIIGDYVVVCPVLEMARLEAKAGNPMFTYYFAHRTSGLSTREWTGVAHGSEVPYLFGTLASVVGANYTVAEAMLSLQAMQYSAAFAQSGKPITGEGSTKQWPSYNPTKQNFERIGLKPPRAETVPHASRGAFWAALLSEKPSAAGAGSGLAQPGESGIKS